MENFIELTKSSRETNVIDLPHLCHQINKTINTDQTKRCVRGRVVCSWFSLAAIMAKRRGNSRVTAAGLVYLYSRLKGWRTYSENRLKPFTFVSRPNINGGLTAERRRMLY